MQIRDIIQKICDFHEPYEEPPKSRDKYLAGDPDQPCTGIAVTVCASMEALRQAVEQGINLILSHESVFCGTSGDIKDIENNDTAREKFAYIQEHGLVIWRYHDHMHGALFDPDRKRPDYIFCGICQELGWEAYVLDDPMKPALYRIPEISASELAEFLMVKFNLTGLRIVGDMDCKVSTVCMAAPHGLKLLADTDVCLGLHTNVCLGTPCADPEELPGLLDEPGKLRAAGISGLVPAEQLQPDCEPDKRSGDALRSGNQTVAHAEQCGFVQIQRYLVKIQVKRKGKKWDFLISL